MTKIDVSITGPEKIVVAGSPATLATFGDAIENAVGGAPDRHVINLICDNDVPMGVVFDVQRELQNRDLLKISYNSDLPQAMPLVLPSKELEEKVKSIPDEDIVIVGVRGKDTVLLNSTEISANNLSDEVKNSLRKNDHLIFAIDMDRDATYGDFVKVLHAVKEGDATRILINNHPR